MQPRKCSACRATVGDAVQPEPALRHWILLPALTATVVYLAGFTLKHIPALTTADQAVVDAVRRHRTPFLDGTATALNTLFGLPGGTILLAAACVLVLLLRRSLADAVLVGSSTVAGCVACWAMKLAVGRPGPGNRGDMALWGVSFPSGHTTCAVSLGIALVLLLRGTRWQAPAAVSACLIAVVVAASRVYLAAHYSSDTIASFVLSAAAIAFWWGAWNRLVRLRAGRVLQVAAAGS